MNTHLYQEKYRISSTGLRGWDYASNAAYYVTIVTQQHRHVFGAIHEGRMYHNALGTAAFECWQEIPKHFPFVVLDTFVIMPNHAHGIIMINKSPARATQPPTGLIIVIMAGVAAEY